MTEIMSRPLDAGYVELAARKAAGLADPPRKSVKALAATAAIVLGLAAGTAIAALRGPDPVASRAAQTLITDTEERQSQVAALAEENRRLAEAVEALERSVLESIDPEAARGAALVGIAAGATRVTGPGLEVTITEDPQAQEEAARVRAGDIQVVVGGLWQAGAEAIAVNGIRLTATSPISAAGQAIHVDLAPIAPPYRISAIGDAEVLQIKLARTDAGARIALLRNQYGAKVDVSARSSLELPAAGGRGTLYYAQDPVWAPTPAPPEEEGLTQ
jgi:uncharacterized protein YlxW (UPF0749 family)